MKQLTVRDVTETIAKKQLQREETYKVILEQCYKKIQKSATSNNICLFYEVPEFVFGHPLYNLNECIIYLQARIKLNGFLVKYYFPNILYISWDVKEIDDAKLKEESKKMDSIQKYLTCTSPGNQKPARSVRGRKRVVINV